MKTLIRTIAVGYLYYPHVWLLRLVGPRAAVVTSRVIAFCHWLLTFFGSDRGTLNAIRSALPRLETRRSARAILRRYLMVKHQHFAEWYGYPTARGRQFTRHSYRNIEGKHHLDDAVAQGRGVILLVFHHGLVKMGIAALHEAGYDVHQHVFRGKTYQGLTYDWMATAAMNRLAAVEKASGLKCFYHRPMQSLINLARFLKRGGIVAMNGDGMMGDDFVTVPFLGSSIELPLGPAQLAAYSGAVIVPMLAVDDGLFRHRLILRPPLEVEQPSEGAIEQAVRDYGRILENKVRTAPGQWWTWRRLLVRKSRNGQIQYGIQALSADKGDFHYTPNTATPTSGTPNTGTPRGGVAASSGQVQEQSLAARGS